MCESSSEHINPGHCHCHGATMELAAPKAVPRVHALDASVHACSSKATASATSTCCASQSRPQHSLFPADTLSTTPSEAAKGQNGLYDLAQKLSEKDSPTQELLALLPPLPEPNRWEMRSESACGCGLVLGLIAVLVTATRHMTAKIAGHVNEAILALMCLLGLMWGDGGVVQRSRRTCFPVPPAVLAALQAGSSLDHFQNIIEGDSSYCVRCCVWRRTTEGKPTSSCRRVFLCDTGSEYNFHHCSVCQRCVSNFDHHCGVFGRCIAGVGLTGNMGFFTGIILLGLAGGLTCFASVFLGLIYQELRKSPDGFLLSVILMAYFTPMFLGCCVFLCSMLWPERGCSNHCPKRDYVKVLQVNAGAATTIGSSADLEMRDVRDVKVCQLEDEVLQLREERDVLTAENGVISEHIHTLQKENSLLHTSGLSSSAENTRLMQAHESVTGEATSLRQELKVVLEERALLRSSLDALKAGNAQLQHSVRGLETSLATVRGDLEQRINTQGAMEEHIASLRKQLESVLAEKVKAEGLISSQHMEILSLHKLRDEFLAEKATGQALVQKLEASEAELSRSKKDKAALDQLVSSLHVDCAKMRTQRDSALAEVPHLKSSIQQQDVLMKDLENQVTALQQQLQSSKNTSGRVDQQAKHLAFALERSREDGARHEQAALALRVERTRLLEALERLRRGKAESDLRASASANEHGLLQAHVEHISSDREQLQVQLHQSTSEASAIRSRLAGLEQMVQAYADKCAALQQEVSSLQDDKAELQEKLEAAPRAARSPERGAMIQPAGSQGWAL
eukprot:s1399_g18.t1